jgi:hypothetical protein
MIRIRDASTVEIAISDRLASWDAGTGPIIIELSESTPTPPGITNGILLEDLVSFLMMEDTTSYLLQEA